MRLQANYPQIYGLAFLFVGLAGPINDSISRTWLQNVGTGLYSFASSSGSVFFALNFGDEGMQQSS
jgi:alpha-1,3-glucan synthase